jgi:hypothetical protein
MQEEVHEMQEEVHEMQEEVHEMQEEVPPQMAPLMAEAGLAAALYIEW